MSEVEVLAVSAPEAARCLGVSPRTIATPIVRKELPSRKIGRRRTILVRALEGFLRRDHHTVAARPIRRSGRCSPGILTRFFALGMLHPRSN